MMNNTQRLSRRERQILDVLHRVETASAAEVRAALEDAPTYSTVRTLLRVMEDKGLVTRGERGRAYVYSPAVPAHVARRSALRHLVTTFFGGSVEDAAVALLDLGHASGAARRKLSRRIAQARREGR